MPRRCATCSASASCAAISTASVRKARPVDELHHQKRAFARQAVVEDLDDVEVAQCRDALSLGQEPLPCLRAAAELREQLLDRDRPLEFPIRRFNDAPHATLAKRLANLVSLREIDDFVRLIKRRPAAAQIRDRPRDIGVRRQISETDVPPSRGRRRFRAQISRACYPGIETVRLLCRIGHRLAF
jgi:hypothetical protein